MATNRSRRVVRRVLSAEGASVPFIPGVPTPEKDDIVERGAPPPSLAAEDGGPGTGSFGGSDVVSLAGTEACRLDPNALAIEDRPDPVPGLLEFFRPKLDALPDLGDLSSVGAVDGLGTTGSGRGNVAGGGVGGMGLGVGREVGWYDSMSSRKGLEK